MEQTVQISHHSSGCVEGSMWICLDFHTVEKSFLIIVQHISFISTIRLLLQVFTVLGATFVKRNLSIAKMKKLCNRLFSVNLRTMKLGKEIVASCKLLSVYVYRVHCFRFFWWRGDNKPFFLFFCQSCTSLSNMESNLC